MTQIDKQELRNLKATLLNLDISQPAIMVQTLTDINISLCSESIILQRNLNQLFLYLNTHKTADKANIMVFRNRLITQIDSVIGGS